MLDAIHLVWSHEGLLGFYKAIQAQILKTVLSAALMLMIKEKISKGGSSFSISRQNFLRHEAETSTAKSGLGFKGLQVEEDWYIGHLLIT